MSRFAASGTADLMAEAFGGQVQVSPLTDTEARILERLALGLSTKQVALDLSYSMSYVHRSLRVARDKLGALTPTRAVVVALERGWIFPATTAM